MNKSKLFMFVSIAILAVTIVVSGATYAWYTWSTGTEEETKIVTNLGTATVYYDAGSNIEGVSLKPVSSKEEGIVKGITIKSDRDTTYKLSFNLYLDVIELGEGLKDASFKYSLYKDSALVKEGNFSSDSLTSNLVTCTTNSTNHIVLLNNETITTTKSVYTLYIWIDGTMSNPNTMQNQTFNFKLHADGQNAVLGTPPITATEYITNLYTNADKTVVTNNSIEYNYATSVSLMNDRLGGTTTDYNAGNIRYYGASPNNYIYFNCSDYSNQSSDTCELWRIIGVFDGKVKIIRNESIGDYSWDSSESTVNKGYGVNEWSQADIMKLLNSGYEREIVGGSLYWNSGSGTCYNGESNATTSCDFTSAGLKNDTTRNMIEEVTWNLGGWTFKSVYSDQIYEYERGTNVVSNPSDGVTRTTSWTGKVALMYPSDYGYATDFTKCLQDLYSYDSSTNSYACRTNDWLYNGAEQWLLTPGSKYEPVAWSVTNDGYVSCNSNDDAAYSSAMVVGISHAVRPVLYLNSEATIESGDGTTSLPYRLSVS